MEPSPDQDPSQNPSSDRKKSDLGPEEVDLWVTDDELDLPELPSEAAEEDLDPGEEEYDPLDEELDEEPDPTPPPQLPETEPSPSILPQFSRKELTWIGALGVVVLGVMIYALTLFFGDINTTTPDKAKFPVKGENIVIRKIETYWRKPDREQDKGIRLDAKFIPAADVTLKSSGSGALRFFFENPDGDRIGDSTSLSFSGGSFDATGNNTAKINATSGFEDIGNYNDYLTEKVHFWHLIVLEGPGLQAQGSEFEEILRMRISPKRR